jgi:hypothetical protein
VLICSLATAVNSFILQRPAFSVFGFVSSLRVNSASWGYNQLDQYIQKELEGKKPRLTFPTRYSWLETLRNQALASDYQAAPILIVYDHRLDQSAALWYLHRRLIYNAWPIMPVAEVALALFKKITIWDDRPSVINQTSMEIP